MRLSRVLMSLSLLCAAAFAGNLTGIQVSYMDRKADPCTDFYEYANGAWRASNPIPASMEGVGAGKPVKPTKRN